MIQTGKYYKVQYNVYTIIIKCIHSDSLKYSGPGIYFTNNFDNMVFRDDLIVWDDEYLQSYSEITEEEYNKFIDIISVARDLITNLL